MSERVALITGGARGIARAIALDLATQGWSVAICYRTSSKEADETKAQIEENGGRGLAEQCDVSDPVAAEGIVRQVEQKWGRIDALINGAGPYQRKNLLEVSIEDWHSMFDNNLHPLFYLGRAVAPGMKERKWGRIISFSMANADRLLAQPHLTAHYISKVGVLIFTRSLARLLAPHGITVNAISPGFIHSGSAPPEELESMTKKIPAGYIGDTQDVVGLVRYLLSDDARYINGSNVQVSGAWGV